MPSAAVIVSIVRVIPFVSNNSGPVPKREQGGAVRWRRLPCIAQLRDKGTSPGPVSCREDGLCATLAAPADRWAAAGVVPLAVLQIQGQGSPCDTL